MRTLSRLFLCSLALTVFAACGGGDDTEDPAPDAAVTVPDADTTPAPDAAPMTVNGLGQVCDMNIMCPEGNSCTGVQGVGDPERGYCSPSCTEGGTECTDGYTGPSGGMPLCALSEASGAPPTLCAILCTAPEQCPTGTACIPVPGQSASICAPPAP